MDNTPKYKEQYMGEYLDMMSYYTDCEGIEIPEKELIEFYDFSKEYWKKRYENSKSIDCYMWMQVAEFNKARLQKNFQIVLDMIKDIHSINNAKALSTIEQMLNDVKNLDEQLYNKAFEIVSSTELIACM